MVTTTDRREAARELRVIGRGIDGTETAETILGVANELESGVGVSDVARRLKAAADGIDGTGTEARIREVLRRLT